MQKTVTGESKDVQKGRLRSYNFTSHNMQKETGRKGKRITIRILKGIVAFIVGVLRGGKFRVWVIKRNWEHCHCRAKATK